MSIPKPKHCEQNWLDMKPTEGGRICNGCNKLIVDFTKSTWREIEAVQAANNNAVCGMYTDKQLRHWGQQPTASKCSKIAASMALFASLASITQVNAQDSNEARTIVRGYVFNADDSTKPFAEATIWLKGTTCGTQTNEKGYYELDITSYVNTNSKIVISYEYIATFENLFEVDNKQGDIRHDVYLKIDIKSLQASAFYVRKPKLKDKLKHKLKRKKKTTKTPSRPVHI